MVGKEKELNMKELDNKLLNAKTAEETAFLLAAGADVNAKDKDGTTPLMLAKTAEQTKLLIDAGADVNAMRNDGKTALRFAVGWNNIEQTKLLIAAGADVNAKDSEGKTALMYAEANKKQELIELLKTVMNPKYAKTAGTKKRLQSEGRSLKGKKSGVIFADAIAMLKRSGVIKGDVTPEQTKVLKEKFTETFEK